MKIRLFSVPRKIVRHKTLDEIRILAIKEVGEEYVICSLTHGVLIAYHPELDWVLVIRRFDGKLHFRRLPLQDLFWFVGEEHDI